MNLGEEEWNEWLGVASLTVSFQTPYTSGEG